MPFLLRRLAFYLVAAWVAITANFFIPRAMPGNPVQSVLAKYPNLTVARALQELQARGFAGQYTVVRQRMRRLRSKPATPPVLRFETGPGDHYVKQSAM